MNSRFLPSHLFVFGKFLFGLACAASLTSSLFAATNHWAGGSCETPVVGTCKWSSAQNWIEMAAPANNGSADIIFLGEAGLTPEMNSAWNVNSVTFDTTAGTFTCKGGGNALTIQAGGL